MTLQDVNIGYSFARIASAHPELDAIIAPDLKLNYAKLWRIARGFAVRMQGLGIDRNSTVAVHTTDMIAAVASMLAAALLGARYATLESGLIESGAVLPTHFLRSPEVTPLPDIPYKVMDGTWPMGASANTELNEGEFPGYANPEDPWWFLQTSGTTGTPKYLIISQRAVHDRSLAVRSDFQPLETIFCPLFPCHTRPFFVRATAALLNACTIVDSRDFAFMQSCGVNLVCGAPFTAMEWLADRVISPKIRLLQVSGAKLPDRDAAILLRSFESVEDVYGSSETNKAFVNVISQGHSGIAKTGSPQDSQVEIIDEKGKACLPNVKGTIRIHNGYMASEYIGMPEASAKVFRNGWFYPGDIGHWGSAGELHVSGRNDEIINLGGSKIDPASVEKVLCSVPGIAAAACFRDPVELPPPRLMAVLTLLAGYDANASVHTAYRKCHEQFGEALSPHIIYVVPSIPLTKDGTPNRSACQRMTSAFNRPTPVTIPQEET